MDTTLKIIFVIYLKQQQSSIEPFSLHFEFSFRYNHNVMVMEEKQTRPNATADKEMKSLYCRCNF